MPVMRSVMALDFPNSPANGEVYTAVGLTWVWDGAKWTTGASGYVQPMMVVSHTQTLPAGFAGFIRVENNTNAPITITLPPSPVASQEITLVDTYGNASAYPVTIIGNGPTINGQVALVLNFDRSWAELMFTGAEWVQN